jgi:hypothetical protein
MLPRRFLAMVVISLGASWTAAAQSAKTPVPPRGALTISGCVARSDMGADQFTMVDSTGKTTYRLIGGQVRQYVGKRVEVVGGVVESKKLKISGGLRPSPNVAAQAGAIDPAGAAASAAAAAAPGTAAAPTLDFKVRTIQLADGACEERR